MAMLLSSTCGQTLRGFATVYQGVLQNKAACPPNSQFRARKSFSTGRKAGTCHVYSKDASEQAIDRSMHESQQVQNRIRYIADADDFESAVTEAGDKLLVLEVLSDEHCESGLTEEAEVNWELDRKALLQRCSGLKHSLQRVASECPDVQFLAMQVVDHNDPAARQVGVTVLPSVQFYRQGKKLWEHKGVLNLEQELGEGVLYYGDTAANNEKASSYVVEMHTKQDIDAFLAAQPSHVLSVVNVSMEICEPCIHIYPAVLALAKSFQGYASFGRLIGDETDEFEELLGELQITEVPTFIFYRSGQEVGRHVGSSRGDLIGKILELQQTAGINPPDPARPARRRIIRRVSAKK